MDTEGFDLFKDSARFRHVKSVDAPMHKLRVPTTSETQQYATTSLAYSHGMPWNESIDPHYAVSYNGSTVHHPFYMPFWEHQLSFLQKQLRNLRPIPVLSSQATDMSYSATDKVRIHTCAFESDEYSRIRMTLMDAGHNTQVFTSLLYPRANLPVLGIDLLQFRQKHLCIMDFQPIHNNECDHACAYESVLERIRTRYPLLQEKMTSRFYDETTHFSSNTLLGRQHGVAGHEMVWQHVFPAFQECLMSHFALTRQAASSSARLDFLGSALAQQGHAAYDTYSAARDPAHAMLAKTFGQEWADDYVYDVLFPRAVRQ
jgi:hypothetical protein